MIHRLHLLQLTTDSDTSDIKVLVSVPPLCPPEDWRKLAETFFEDKGIGGLYLANKSVLAMYGGGRTTGICVDTGMLYFDHFFAILDLSLFGLLESI